jgi:hypothetical protein
VPRSARLGLAPGAQKQLGIPLAREWAHAQRRHVGEATAALLTAERINPEYIHAHVLARETIHDLLGLAGRRPTEELQQVAKRCGAIP